MHGREAKALSYEEFRSQLSTDRNVRAVEDNHPYLIVSLKKRKSRKPVPEEVWILYDIPAEWEDYIITLEGVTDAMNRYRPDADYILESAVSNLLQEGYVTEAAKSFLKGLKTISYEQLLSGINTRRIP